MVRLICTSIFLYVFTGLIAQDGAAPTVFQFGEHEVAFEGIAMRYQTQLLEMCDDNIERASGKWRSMLAEMEAHAKGSNFDIMGAKMWMQAFFSKNGKIDHLVFHLKPESRNIPPDDLQQFLEDFYPILSIAINLENKLFSLWERSFSNQYSTFRILNN